MVNDYRFKVLESLKCEYGERIISDTGFQWSIFGEMGIIAALMGFGSVHLHESRSLFNDPRPMTLALSLLAHIIRFFGFAISSDTISIYAIPIGITPTIDADVLRLSGINIHLYCIHTNHCTFYSQSIWNTWLYS